MNRDVVIIPAYKPDEKLIDLAKELKQHSFGILVINDGSGEKYDSVFQSLSGIAKVIHNQCNLGKGCTLKHGFSKVRELFPNCENMITADADGQHKVKDILAVRDAMHQGKDFVLTVRGFQADNMPGTSKLGNTMSRYIFTLMTGKYFHDNQSGLRGFSVEHCDWLTRIRGDKYDYELNMLYFAQKQGIHIHTVGIETVYIDGNKSSHFSASRDTFLIYKLLFQSGWTSFGTSALCYIMAVVATLFLQSMPLYFVLPGIGIISIPVFWGLNKITTFHHIKFADMRRKILCTIFRYMVITGLCMLLDVIGCSLLISYPVSACFVHQAEYLIHKLLYVLKR